MNKGIRFFGLVAAAAIGCMSMFSPALAESEEVTLKFNEEGKFKIMQMSDFQDYVNDEKPTVHEKSIALMGAALDSEQPDLVVMTGDQIGGDMNADQFQDYVTQMVQPLEERNIPWMITFGNHDEDATTALADGWDKIRQLEYYMSFPSNINKVGMDNAAAYDANGVNTHAVGDMYQLIYDAAGEKPLYNVWLLDSNRYADIGGYDWIRTNQINWYYTASKELEAEYGKLNSLMFFHIPTPEWGAMYADGEANGVTGNKNESECPSNINSGMFAAALERGDVRGIFVGHDHVNDYVGDYYGIKLGYDANVGFQTYGLGGDENDKLRGVRVFELDASDLTTFTTRMVYASDLGIE